MINESIINDTMVNSQWKILFKRIGIWEGNGLCSLIIGE